MKQPTPYPHKRQQILARLLLTIWLPVICSPEATLAAPSSEAVGSVASTSTGPPGLPPPAMDAPTTVTLTAREDQQVTFRQNNGFWQAEVNEDLSLGASNKPHLPVSIKKGMPWQQLANYSKAIQRQRVVVDLTSENSQVSIDSRGLWSNISPLYEVVSYGALALVPEILAEGGSDINTVDDQGYSALHWAVSKGHKAVAALLIRHGADVALADKKNKTPLGYAHQDDVEYFSAIRDLVKLFSDLDDLIENDSINNQAEIKQKLYEAQSHIKDLENENIEVYSQFMYRYCSQEAKYLRAIGKDTRASRQEKRAEEYQKQNVSLLSLDADLQKTLAVSSSTSEENDIIFHKKHGDETWRQFIDHCSAQQEPWGLLTRLGREDPDKLSSDQADSLKYVSIAHAKYVESCLEAAKKQDLHSEINLRAIMALRLLIVGCFLEAKMYALSVCSKLINSPSDSKVIDLRKAQVLLARIQEAQLACSDRPTTTSSATNTLNTFRKVEYHSNRFSTLTVQEGYAETDKMHIKCAIAQDLQEIARELLLSNTRKLASPPVCDGRPTTASSATNTLNIVRESNKEYSDTDKIEIKCAIAQDLQEIARELLLSNARNLPTIQVPEARIFRTEQLAKRYKQAGVGTGIVGGILLGFLVVLGGHALFKFIQNRKKSSTPLAQATSPNKTNSPSPKRVWEFVFTATGILGVLTLTYGRCLWNKGERVRQESVAFRGLNAMLAQAQACYDQGKMQEFLNELSSEYDKNKRLLLLKEMGENAALDKLIGLIKYGIRPDGVAGLFQLIARALLSGQVKLPGHKTYALRHLARENFKGALSPELAKAIQDLDKRMAEIEEQRNKRSPWEQYVETWKNFLLLRDEDAASLLASTHPGKDAQGVSVEQRLEAISKIAQMGLTSTDMEIINRWLTSIDRASLREKNKLAERLVQEAREAIEDYLQLYPMPGLRSEATKDYLKVISDHIAAIEAPAADQKSNS